jgi:superfamily II DNA/RNA helicase
LNFLNETHGIDGPFLVIVPLTTKENWDRELKTWSNFTVLNFHLANSSEFSFQTNLFKYRTGQIKTIPKRMVLTKKQIKRDKKKAKGKQADDDEYTTSSDDEEEKIVVQEEADPEELTRANVVLTTYEMISSYTKLFKPVQWKCIICDEAHRIKSLTSKIRKSVDSLKREHLILLTGTPLQNQLTELWSLLHALAPDVFDSQERFDSDFAELQTEEQVTKLQKMIIPYLMRRTKSEVFSKGDLPPKEEIVVYVELTKQQKVIYRALIERKSAFFRREYSDKNSVQMNMIVHSLRSVCNHPFLVSAGIEERMKKEQPNRDINELMIECSAKLILLDKLLKKFFENDEKVLIFSQMLQMLDILEDYLTFRQYSYVRIDGGTSSADRTEHIDKFCTDKETRVFLLSTKAGGVGINLVAANNVVIYDSDFNPFNDSQAAARCHRIGQEKPVKIYRLIARNSYEKYILESASKKLGLESVILAKQSQIASQPTDDNVEDEETVSLNNDLLEPNDDNQTMKRSDIEKMLRYGVYHLLMKNDDDESGDNIMNQDIDTILKTSSETIALPEEDDNRALKMLTNLSQYDSDDEEAEEARRERREKRRLMLLEQQKAEKSKEQVTSAFFAADNETTNIHADDFWEKVFPDYIDTAMMRNRINNSTPFSIPERDKFFEQLTDLVQELLFSVKKKTKVTNGAEEELSKVKLYDDDYIDDSDDESESANRKRRDQVFDLKNELHIFLIRMLNPTVNMHYSSFTSRQLQKIQDWIDEAFGGRALRSNSKKGAVIRRQDDGDTDANSDTDKEDQDGMDDADYANSVDEGSIGHEAAELLSAQAQPKKIKKTKPRKIKTTATHPRNFRSPPIPGFVLRGYVPPPTISNPSEPIHKFDLYEITSEERTQYMQPKGRDNKKPKVHSAYPPPAPGPAPRPSTAPSKPPTPQGNNTLSIGDMSKLKNNSHHNIQELQRKLTNIVQQNRPHGQASGIPNQAPKQVPTSVAHPLHLHHVLPPRPPQVNYQAPPQQMPQQQSLETHFFNFQNIPFTQAPNNKPPMPNNVPKPAPMYHQQLQRVTSPLFQFSPQPPRPPVVQPPAPRQPVVQSPAPRPPVVQHQQPQVPPQPPVQQRPQTQAYPQPMFSQQPQKVPQPTPPLIQPPQVPQPTSQMPSVPTPAMLEDLDRVRKKEQDIAALRARLALLKK